MWIQVRTIDGKKTVRVDSLSKLTKIEELRERLIELFDAQPSDQRLFFRGKQLEDGHTLFDYDVGLNDLIQLMIRIKPALAADAPATPTMPARAEPKDGAEDHFSDKENNENFGQGVIRPSFKIDDLRKSRGLHSPDSDAEFAHASSSLVCLDLDEGNIYKVGDIIDARDPMMGAWFEAKILDVIRDRSVGQHHRCASRPPASSISGAQTAGLSSSIPSADSEQRVVLKDSKEKMQKHSDESTVNKKIDKENSDVAGKEDIGALEIGTNEADDKTDDEQIGEQETVIKDENCNEGISAGEENGMLQKREVSMATDDGCMTDCDEPGCAVVPSVKKTECATVLSPKKMSTSKDNMAEAGISANRLLFKREMSDDLKKQGILRETTVSDGFIYKVVFDGYEEDVVELSSKDIRPRARHLLPFDCVKEGQMIMANFNYDEPESRGFWYDCLITKKKDTRTQKELHATVYLGADLMSLENCRLLFLTELFEIEKPGTQLTEQDIQLDPTASPAKRQNKPECDFCKDNPRRKCKHCACCVCGGKNEPEKQLMCDECDRAYHLDCLNPPLTSVPPDDDWYCPECKRDENEVVKAGEKLKESKKKSRMASASSSSSRDWGKGMACVGRTKQCTIVPSNHYGPIPGVEVGTMWKFRVQVSEAGVHRPHVAGIHGREEDGAFSIVLSGGYEDDADNGDEFYYTGSGGRDLSGNKRTAEQSCDQKLTRMNRALAKNCNVAINNKTGAEATDWRGGKPVRVVRNCKGRKHSKYAPVEGNRYDGIYKVVKYWSEKGKSGFLVWRYLLRRDDPAPAPWTKEGKMHCQQLGLAMQYPEGYLQSQAEKEKALLEGSEEDSTPKKRGRKRKAESIESEKEGATKAKRVAFQVDRAIMKLIREDTVNKKLWDQALATVSEGKQKFVQQLEEVFMCICCQEILYKPVTLQCTHNFCKPCIKRSFKAEVYSCPACRMEVAKDSALPVNAPLAKVLNHFYPGYEAGRE